jgi:ubiquinol-cytochrome c reductase cytochrome b subunit
MLRQPIFSIVNDHLIEYPTPSNFNYWWNFGSLAGLCLVIQLATGIFLAMHYIPHVDFAFNSVEHIMRDVEGGWFLRYFHMNGASLFFIIVYLHVFRGLYYASYAKPREMVWVVGVVILLLMILTAFIGYVLPWGQMSLWGATVITSLASAIPIVGQDITYWVWGGFSVENPTLNRFFSIHYLFPFLIAGATIVHLAALHQYGSNNPLGINATSDKVPFFPYFYVKDVLGVVCFALVFSYFLFYNPNVLGHPDNYIPANPMVTPPHIVPEFYFLPFYAVLRSIPNKLGGVVAMLGMFVCLVALPWLHTSPIRSTTFRPVYRCFFWIFVANALLLGWLGQCPVEDPYILLGQICSVFYFFYFLVLTPALGHFERQAILG